MPYVWTNLNSLVKVNFNRNLRYRSGKDHFSELSMFFFSFSTSFVDVGQVILERQKYEKFDILSWVSPVWGMINIKTILTLFQYVNRPTYKWSTVVISDLIRKHLCTLLLEWPYRNVDVCRTLYQLIDKANKCLFKRNQR